MYGDILVPTDGSEPAGVALDHALALAAATDATVHVLYVADTAHDSVTVVGTDVIDALESEGERVVAAAADRARERGVTAVTEVLQGDPPRTIVDYAGERGVDAIVMGTHGRRGLERFLLGSVTERVMRSAPVPVIAIRADADGGERDR